MKIINYMGYLVIILLLNGCAHTVEKQIYRGVEYFTIGKYDRAITKFENVLNKDVSLNYYISEKKTSLGVLLSIAYSFNMLPDSAINIARQSLSENKGDPQLLFASGIAQLSKNDIISAKYSLEEAIKLDPNLWYAHDWLASIHLIEGDIEKAILEFEYSIELLPRLYHARAGIIIIESLKGNQDIAIQEFKQLIFSMKILNLMALFKYDENSKLFYNSLNSIINGNLDEANLQLQKYLNDNHIFGVNFLYGIIYILKGDKLSAIKFFEKDLYDSEIPWFFSKMWLSVLYAFNGDLENFFIARIPDGGFIL